VKRGLTGRYQITKAGGEEVRSFIPFPLPPKPPLDLSSSRQHLLERATLALGRLDSITILLPDPDLFLYSYVRQEAVLSSQIEGTQSSLSDLMMFELQEAPGVPLDDVVEVSNYVAALEYGMDRIRNGFPLSNRLIREMHARLLSSGRGSEKSPGEFRHSQNWIGGTRPGTAHFVPPPPAYVEDCMADLERFIHDKDSPYPALIKAALAHVQFETIHPFLDGNGRVGRLIIAILLHHSGVLSQPLLYLSLYFKKYRDEYYRLLDLVRLEGDWEAWLDFFLEGVEQTANGAVITAKKLVKMFEEDEEKLKELKRAKISTINIFNIFRSRPILTVAEVCKRSGLTFPSASKAIENLIRVGIVQEITGKQRDRIFVYKQYLSILSEGTEQI